MYLHFIHNRWLQMSKDWFIKKKFLFTMLLRFSVGPIRYSVCQCIMTWPLNLLLVIIAPSSRQDRCTEWSGLWVPFLCHAFAFCISNFLGESSEPPFFTAGILFFKWNPDLFFSISNTSNYGQTLKLLSFV